MGRFAILARHDTRLATHETGGTCETSGTCETGGAHKAGGACLAEHEEFENFAQNLNDKGVEVYTYDQLGSFYSDQPDFSLK